jgi:hypothetical protein
MVTPNSKFSTAKVMDPRGAAVVAKPKREKSNKIKNFQLKLLVG